MDHVHCLLTDSLCSRLTVNFLFNRNYKNEITAALSFHYQSLKRLVIGCTDLIRTVDPVNKFITFIGERLIFNLLSVQHSHCICLSFFCHFFSPVLSVLWHILIPPCLCPETAQNSGLVSSSDFACKSAQCFLHQPFLHPLHQKPVC